MTDSTTSPGSVPTTTDKLKVNAANAWRMASNWVMVLAGGMWAVWLALPLDQQQLIIAHLPVPPWSLPIATSVAGVVARLWPQKAITPAIAAAKSTEAPTDTPPSA